MDKTTISKFICLILVVMTITNSYAQYANRKIDSLTVLVNKTKNDSLKCGLYIDVANEYLTTDIAKRDEYLTKARKLLTKVNARKLSIKLSLLQTYVYLLEGKNDQVLQEISRIQKSLKTNYYEDLYLNSVYIQSMALNYSGQIDTSIKLLEATIRKISDSKHSKDMARVYFSLGQSYGFIYDIPNAIKNIKIAIEYYKKAKFESGIFTSYSEICYGYMRIGNYNKALYYSNLCKIYSKTDSNKYAEYLTNGQLYYFLKKYDQSIDFLKKGLVINNKLKDDLNKPNLLIFLIKCYIAKKDADNLFQLCRSNASSNPTSFMHQFVTDFGLASAYFLNKNYKLANQYVDLINARLDKGTNEWITEDEFIMLYKLTAEIKFALADFKQAYLYQSKYIERYNKFEENLKNQNALQLQDELDSYIKDNRINELTLLKKESNLKIQNQQYYIIIYSIVILFMVVIIVVIVFFFRKIQIKNKVISKNAQVILEQNNTISQSLAVKELLLKEIHHRVKNNLQIVMNLLKIQARESTLTSIDEFVKKGQARILTMSLIHENLYATDHLDTIDLQKYIADLVANLKSLINWGHEEIDINIKVETIYFDIQNAVPLGLIINELLTNSFKHAFNKVEKGEINISLKQKENKAFELSYSDSGPGFELKQTDRKTLGLELIHQLTRQLNGTVQNVNQKNNSYRIIFKTNF